MKNLLKFPKTLVQLNKHHFHALLTLPKVEYSWPMYKVMFVQLHTTYLHVSITFKYLIKLQYEDPIFQQC